MGDLVFPDVMPASKKNKKPLSSEHKAALAEGRQSGNAIRRYLEALEDNRPKRGRRRSPESIANRLAEVNDAIPTASPIKRLSLLQEKENLEKAQAAPADSVDLSTLEDEFVEAAAAYGERKGISYATWRAMGVPAPLLARAGITRSGS